MSNDRAKGKVRARAAEGATAGEALVELDTPLEERVRRSAREILQRAIEAEVQTLLADYANVRLRDGRLAVVRNGYLPSREIRTGIGPVGVQVPKVRDRSGSGVKFQSGLVPAYVRRTPRVSAALPWLYRKGISSGDLGEALGVLLGDQATGLSANVLGRLKAQWAQEYQNWGRRSLAGQQYVYWWADGIYTPLREEDDERLCLRVIIAVTAEGRKEWVALSDGFRESTASWLEVLRDRRDRALALGPRLAVGDGALGLGNALAHVYPDTAHQRCWVHKSANVLAALPKSLQAKAKADLQQIWMAPSRREADRAFERFLTR